MTTLLRIFDKITDWAAVLAGVIIAFVGALVCADVFMRYVFNKPIIGVLETAEFGLLFFTLLPAAYLLRKDRHVKMDLLINKLRPKAAALLNITTYTLCAFVCALITFYGVVVVIERFTTKHRLTTTLEPLSYPLYAIIPVGFFLLFIAFVVWVLQYAQEYRDLSLKTQDNASVTEKTIE